MGLLGWIVVFTLVGGVAGVLLASVFLAFPDRVRTRLLPALLSFATGSLLGGAFLGLIPHALEHRHDHSVETITFAILAGMVGFFVVEKILIFRHCHAEECEAHVADEARAKASASLILLGDTVHNFVDGVVIGAAFLADFRLGVAASLAAAAHEIPQELADFAILLHGGLSRGRALLLNALSGLATVLGGVAAYFALHPLHDALPIVIAVAAANFLYVAVADLIPTLHRRTGLKSSLLQIACIAAGVGVIALAARAHGH